MNENSERQSPSGTSQVQVIPKARVRFTDHERLKICQAIAEYRDYRKAAEIALEDYGIDVTVTAIKNYASKEPWRTIILDFRKIYMEGIAHLGIANKRWRMERLQELYSKISTADYKYGTKEQVEALLRILHQAQGEVETKKGSNIDHYNQQFNIVFHTPGGKRLGMDELRPALDTETVPRKPEEIPGSDSGSAGG